MRDGVEEKIVVQKVTLAFVVKHPEWDDREYKATVSVSTGEDGTVSTSLYALDDEGGDPVLAVRVFESAAPERAVRGALDVAFLAAARLATSTGPSTT